MFAIMTSALAKDLKIDSKELVEFCNKAGIPGKGSALASLEDDEVAKLKAYLDGVQAKKSGAAPAVPEKGRVGAPIRPGQDVVPVAKKPGDGKGADLMELSSIKCDILKAAS